MTDTEHDPAASTAPAVGDTIHFFRSGLIYRMSVDQFQADVSVRGEQIVVTDGLLAASADRYGKLPAWLRLAGSPAAQHETFGRQIVGLGPAPAGLTSWDPEDTRDSDDERHRRLDAAFRLHDEGERAAALREMHRLVPKKVPNRMDFPLRDAA